MAEPFPRSPREETLQEVRRRLALLSARLDDLKAQGLTTRPDDVDRELAYIDRTVAALPKAARREVDGEVERVRALIGALKRKNVGFALAGLDDSDGVNAGGGPSSFSDGANSAGSASPGLGGKLRSQRSGQVGSQRSFMQKMASLNLRSWKSVDDEREQKAFKDLAGQAADLHEVASEVAGHIESAQGDLDKVCEEMSNTKANIQAAVSSVSEAAKAQSHRWNFIGAAVAFIVIALGLLVAWSTGGNMMLPLAIGLVIGVVVHLLAQVGRSTQARGLDAVKDRVQQAGSWPPLSAEAAERIYREGLEGEIKLLELLDASWPARGAELGGEMTLRSSGGAFKITFELGLAASAAFRLVERLRNDGGLDPGCQAMWARPIDSAGTSLRYSAHDVCYANRDFLVVCRSGPVGTEDGRNQYMIAATSLTPELSALVETESGRRLMARGEARAVGVSVEDVKGAQPSRLSSSWPEAGECRSRVDVLLDVDLHLCCCGRAAARRHAVASARQLSCMFAAAAASRHAGSVEMCDF